MSRLDIEMRSYISKTLFSRVSSVKSGNIGIDYFKSLYRKDLSPEHFDELISCVVNGCLTQEVASQTIDELYIAELKKKSENAKGYEMVD